jgi:hypothetical protein
LKFNFNLANSIEFFPLTLDCFMFQDDDYVYPSLDLSDDEMEIGPNVTQAKDDAWSPKVRVKSVAGKIEPRPTRDGAKKVTAVEMGLKLAAERRRKPKVTPKKVKIPASKKAPVEKVAQQPVLDSESPLASNFTRSPFLSTPVASRLGLTPNAKTLSALSSTLSASKLASPVTPLTPLTASQIKKSKKGMLTAKQRIAKTLGLKF